MASTSRMLARNLLPRPFALARSFDESRDVDEFNRRRDHFVGFGDFAEWLEPVIRHLNDAHVRVDRAKRIVRRFSFACASERVEERALAHIGKSYDTSL